jgi:hypothetical protein
MLPMIGDIVVLFHLVGTIQTNLREPSLVGDIVVLFHFVGATQATLREPSLVGDEIEWLSRILHRERSLVGYIVVLFHFVGAIQATLRERSLVGDEIERLSRILHREGCGCARCTTGPKIGSRLYDNTWEDRIEDGVVLCGEVVQPPHVHSYALLVFEEDLGDDRAREFDRAFNDDGAFQFDGASQFDGAPNSLGRFNVDATIDRAPECDISFNGDTAFEPDRANGKFLFPERDGCCHRCKYELRNHKSLARLTES